MRIVIAFVVITAFFALPGCGKNQGSLVGKWSATASRGAVQDTTKRLVEFTEDQFILHLSDASQWQSWRIEGDRFITGNDDTLAISRRDRNTLVMMTPDSVTYTFNRLTASPPAAPGPAPGPSSPGR